MNALSTSTPTGNCNTAEALKLAELLDSGLQLSAVHHAEAAAELRHLHYENQELLEALDRIQDAIQNFIEKGLRPTESVMRRWQVDARAAIAKSNIADINTN